MNNNSYTVLESITALGYSKRGSIAFKYIDDIIAYFSFDCPSSLIYITFGIVPIFVPSEKYFTYSYAKRINEISPDLKIITKEDNSTIVNRFTDKLQLFVESTINPYIRNISKADKLINTLLCEISYTYSSHLLNYNEYDLMKLITYGYCYIGRRDKSLQYISNKMIYFNKNRSASKSMERLLLQAEELFNYFHNSSEENISIDILSNIQRNKAKFKLK